MNGKSYSIPGGMIFKKFYCSQCGTKLEKEKTHRVVREGDPDYFQYQDFNRFPRRDYDVYEYRFQCPTCGKRIAYDEQCIVEKIQKKQGSRVLSSGEIKADYRQNKQTQDQKNLFWRIAVPVLFLAIFFGLFYYFNTDRTAKDLAGAAVLFLISVVCSAVRAVKRYQGSYKTKYMRSYSDKVSKQMERLHTYSSHNRELVARACKCYCFHCQSVMDSSQIETYADKGQTAICPNCTVDSIIPDSIDEPVDESIIAQMHEFWF